MSKPCCYLMMAGGTGGHIFPAMAVAKLLKDRDADVHWLGTASGMEYSIVPKEKIPLHLIAIKGFRGKSLLSKCLIPFMLLSAILQAIKIIQKVQPDVVVGFGGYASAPGGIAARLLGKKLVVHEQNSVAGTTNKLLAKIASTVLEAFPGSLEKALLVGNPIRKDIKRLFSIDKNNISERKNLLITGGSLGAEAINNIVPQVIKMLPDGVRPLIWHQTGKNKLSQVQEAYKQADIDVRSEEFIESVEEAYQWADIIICRAGALTVSEVAIAGVPAIFIPYPYAIDNHQSTNAQWLVDNKAAILIEQSDLTKEGLCSVLEHLLNNHSELKSMSEQLKKIAMPAATEKVVSICEQICSGEVNHAA